MRTNISKQLGLPVAPRRAKAPSIETQLGFVAEYDKSLDTSNFNFFAENDNYFNATAEEQNFKDYYKGRFDLVNDTLKEYKINTSEDLNYIESVKKRFEEIKSELNGKIQAIKLNQLQRGFGTAKAQDRGKLVTRLWYVDKGIESIDKRIADVKVILEQKAAKAKADSEAAAAKLKAEAEAAKQAKITDLKKQISESNDPNIKKQLSDQLKGLLQEGTEGLKSNKIVLIGGAVVIIGVLYYFFRNKQ